MGEIKLIASDLDGTLLLHGAQKCSRELFPILEALLEKGVLFLPASGRQYPNLSRLFAPVKDQLMYVCENGALVMYQDRVIFKREFPDELGLELCHAVIENPLCEVLISGERVSYLIPKKPQFAAFMRDEVGNDIQVIRRPEDICEPIIKVSYFTRPQDQEQVKQGFLERFGGRCLVVTSGREWVDFAPLGTNKGSALEEIGKKFGIAREEMCAFGDNENDREMLEYVGHPYLMEHSNPAIGDIQGTRCVRVEDSLREILRTWIEKRT